MTKGLVNGVPYVTDKSLRYASSDEGDVVEQFRDRLPGITAQAVGTPDSPGRYLMKQVLCVQERSSKLTELCVLCDTGFGE